MVTLALACENCACSAHRNGDAFAAGGLAPEVSAARASRLRALMLASLSTGSRWPGTVTSGAGFGRRRALATMILLIAAATAAIGLQLAARVRRAGPCARSVPSWLFPGLLSAINSAVPGSPCVAT